MNSFIVQNAEYKPVRHKYQGNPFIEALPSVLTDEQLREKLISHPVILDEYRQLQAHERYGYTADLDDFFQPINKHRDLYQRLLLGISEGYALRNPLEKQRKLLLQESYQVLKGNKKEISPSLMLSNSNLGFGVVGMPGLGKTVSCERILSLFPQVIVHNTKGDYIKQIVWMKINCPHDGNINGLCDSFFGTVDRLLDYESSYQAKSRSRRENNISIKQNYMTHIALLHGIGVLVIDEIQNLSVAKSGGDKKMINFFLELSNKIGLPVVLVGTHSSKEILDRFLYGRRLSGQSFVTFERMKNNRLWKQWLQEMWKFQWTKDITPFSDELSDAIYYHSQGIVDTAVKLFKFSQQKLINHGKREIITPGIIEKVAKENALVWEPTITYIREGVKSQSSKFDDIGPVSTQTSINVGNITREEVKQLLQEIENEKMVKEVEEEIGIDKMVKLLINLNISEEKARKSIKQAIASMDKDCNDEEILHEAFAIAAGYKQPAKKSRGKNSKNYKDDKLEKVVDKVQKNEVEFDDFVVAGFTYEGEENF